MKVFHFLLVWCFLTQVTISAQEVGKMNKSELKEHVQLLTKKVDSLSSEITLNLSYLEKKRVEVNRLNKLLEELEEEKKQKLVEKEAVIATLEQIGKKNEDEISKLKEKIIAQQQEIDSLKKFFLIKETELKQSYAEKEVEVNKLRNNFSTVPFENKSQVFSNSTIGNSQGKFNDNFLFATVVSSPV